MTEDLKEPSPMQPTMNFNENEFFRQATLRICSSLNIEKALFNCLEYIRFFVPASKVSLGLLESDTRTLRNFTIVDHAGSKQSLPPIQMSKDAMSAMEPRGEASDIRLRYLGENDPVARILRPYVELSNHSGLCMALDVDGKRMGTFSVWAEGGGERFTQAHIKLVSLLREPFSIAMSNALRYEEVVRLKDILDAKNRELSRELRHFSSDEIIGADYGMKPVMEMVQEVAPLDSPVILLGETGTGKEVVANAIHYASFRRRGPFVKVNCGAIPDGLMDSELFGHEKGAFTGAISQTRGRFERAEGGTLFFDEIGELPLQAQVRLLRVLQYKEIERVGGSKTISVDVRIIAATHRNMEELVQTGLVREDLWFRLNVFPIMIPPLRQRKEDIPALARHFIRKKSNDFKIYPVPTVLPEEIDRLKAYHWPGNVRELENLVERELIHKRGKGKSGPLTFTHFIMAAKPVGSDLPHEMAPHSMTLDEAMAQHIRRALQRANGKISGARGAAQLLGINANTLRSRMKKLGISFKNF